MADEDLGGEGQGSQASEVGGEQDQAAIAAVGEKMDQIFDHRETPGEHDQKQQDDTLNEEGVVDEDHPDGDGEEDAEAKAKEEADAAAVAEDPDTVEVKDATVEELAAAEKEAVEAGDYDAAKTLRSERLAKEEAAKSAAPNPDAKPGVLDENERSVMKDLGKWTDEEIKILEESNPAFAKLTARKLADGFNNLSLQFAQAARNGVPATQPQPVPNAATVQQTATLESLYKDLDKFSEIAGNEMVERFIKPLKSEVLEPLRDVVAFVNAQRQETTRREVNDAVARVAKGGYEKHYGEDPSSLTDAQRAARQQLGQAADMIHAGAKMQKVDMSFGEAIRRAHLIMTADKQQAQARTALVKQVTKRSTQITSRPTQRVQRVEGRGERAAMEHVAKFWEERD